MIRSLRMLNNKEFLFLVLVFLLVTDFCIYFDIPLIRQFCGFFFLTILPGLLILQILKLNKIESVELFLIVVGISITFLMLFGLLINNISLSLGYKTPLATIPLLISFNIAFIILLVIGYTTNNDSAFSLPCLNFTTSEKVFLIMPILFPSFSIFGIYLMNTIDNNIVVMTLFFLISLYLIFVCFYCQNFPKRFYPVVIILISLSLLLLIALRSNHIIGVDTHQEYYYFQTTLNNQNWSMFGHTTLDSCLAISLLPTVYQSILNVPSEYLFKMLYPLLFSISPLVVYILAKKYIGELYGFMASFYFMSLQNFLWTSLHARTNIAILFFALAMMIFFNDNIDISRKRLLLIAFMASCILSHYSTTYIFLFIMVGMFLGTEMLSEKSKSIKIINLLFIILFFVLIFYWYSQITETAFKSGIIFFENTVNSLTKFFLEEMRSSTARAVLGEGLGNKGIPNKIEFVFTWLTFALMGIGVLTLIKKCKEMSFPELNFEKPEFLTNKFEVAYLVIALECTGLFAGIILIPFITLGYSLDRTYFLGSTVMSVFFIIGGIIAAKYLNKLLSKIIKESKHECTANLIILFVLIPYFLCTTGILYQAFSVPQSIFLNSNGNIYDLMYVHDHDSYGAKWIKRYTDDDAKIYGDHFGGMWLLSQGMVQLSNYNPYIIDNKRVIKTGYVYLRYVNLIEGKFLQFSKGSFKWNNLTNCEYLLDNRDKIYDNSGSQIWN
ncbi:MAG: hypothetical protein A4E52_01281 [Pelotomaculum sp. PtaB.Bin013]|nr:MAG: hypothetical protein A4E52_01281 [Pelotomaculum sp. PtaB.Bin013]